MEFETFLAVGLTALLVYFSTDFSKHYGSGIHDAARNPLMRFLAGACVVGLAHVNPSLAILALIIVFFWIADVHLLSSISFQRT